MAQAQDLYRSFFENAYDAAFIVDAETGMIIETNKEAENLMGYKQAELLKMHQTQLHPPEEKDRYAKLFKNHVFKKQAFEEDVLVQHKSGKRIHVSIRANVVKCDDREIIMGIFRDITKYKDIEEFLKTKISSLEEVLNFIKGREERIITLKKEIDLLLKHLKKPSKYGY